MTDKRIIDPGLCPGLKGMLSYFVCHYYDKDQDKKNGGEKGLFHLIAYVVHLEVKSEQGHKVGI